MSTSVPTEWRDTPLHPHPERDLGYDMLELDMISTTSGSKECYIVMPYEEDMIRDATFMVVKPHLVTDLIDMI